MAAIPTETLQKILKPTDLSQYVNLLKKIQEGAVLNAQQQQKYDSYEEKIMKYTNGEQAPKKPETEDFVGIPEKLRVRRRYTLSSEAIEQRRAAARSPAKAAAMLGNRNNWRHGMYAENFIGKMKPCLSTCSHYPCSLVDEGKTKPGEDCLDKVEVLQFYRAVHKAVKDKDYEEFNDLAALQIGNTIKVIDMLIEDLLRDGTVVRREKYDAKGNLVIEYVTHPSLLALPKLIADLGLTPAEFMITPRAIDKGNTERETAKSLAELMSRAGKVFKKKPVEDE